VQGDQQIKKIPTILGGTSHTSGNSNFKAIVPSSDTKCTNVKLNFNAKYSIVMPDA
jgi:hypothetical protein